MKPSDQAIATAFREYHGGPAFEAATRRIENRAAEIQRDLDAQPSEWAREFVARLVHAGRLIERYENPVMRPLSPENFRIYDSARRTECQSPKELTATVERLLAERDAEIARLRKACSAENDEICQTLGKALGCPWFKDHQDVFPGATEADGVCVGDHVAASLAAEAAKAVESLRAQLAGRAAVPEGWKLVPRRIPDEMRQAWRDMRRAGESEDMIYQAMLAAAPEPAQAAPSGPEFDESDVEVVAKLMLAAVHGAATDVEWAALSEQDRRRLLDTARAMLAAADSHRAQRKENGNEY